MSEDIAPLITLAKDDRYNKEKPYVLRYNPVEGIAADNIIRKTTDNVPIHDIRQLTTPPSIEKNGLMVCDIEDHMQYEDWFSDDKIKAVFYPQLQQRIEHIFGTSNIQIFEYRLRRRTKSFPVSTGNTLDWAQPVTTAHIDFNLSETGKMVYYHNGAAKADELMKYRYGCFNIWKPLIGPVRDWPLALCDASTVDPINDLVTADVVYQDHVEENYQVHYNTHQRWLYLSDQQPWEMLVFRCADSDEGKVGPGVPHCSIPYPKHVTEYEPRESIEMRVLILSDIPVVKW